MICSNYPIKKYLYIAILTLNLSAPSISYAKNLILDNLESGVNIISGIISTLKGLEDLGREEVKNNKFQYRDKIIYINSNYSPDENLVALAKKERELAWEKQKDNKTSKAIKLYESALEKDANDWHIWHGYAYSLSVANQHNESINAYMMAIKLNNNYKSWFFLGEAFKRQEQYEHAISSYKRSLELNPSYILTQEKLKEAEQLLSKNYIPLNQSNNIQIGAFRKKDNADILVQKIKIKGKKAYIEEDTKANLYRVITSDFSSKEELESFKLSL